MGGEAIRLDWDCLSDDEREWVKVRAAIRKRIRLRLWDDQAADIDDATQDAAVLLLLHWNARKWRELRSEGQNTLGLQIHQAASSAVNRGLFCSVVDDIEESPSYLTDERTARNLRSIERHMPRGVARRY